MSTRYEPDNSDLLALSNRMSQETLWELLNLYADEEATPEERARVEALLPQHPFLAGDLAFLRHTSAAARNLAEVEPPVALRAAIYAHTTGRPPFAQRVSSRMVSAWHQAIAALAPRPLVWISLTGGASLAVGLLAVALWPHSQPVYGRASHRPEQIALAPTQTATPKLAAPRTFPPMSAPGETRTTARRQPAIAINTHPHLETDMATPLLASGVEPMTEVAPPHHTPTLRIASAHPEPRRMLRIAELPRSNGRNPERPVVDTPEGHFSVVPMMDLANQRARLASSTDRSGNDSLGANIDSSHEETTVGTDAKSETSPAEAPSKPVHIIRIAQLPPDPHRYLTTADIKREMDARNMGFNRITIEGIKREEATLAVIGGKF